MPNNYCEIMIINYYERYKFNVTSNIHYDYWMIIDFINYYRG